MRLGATCTALRRLVLDHPRLTCSAEPRLTPAALPSFLAWLRRHHQGLHHLGVATAAAWSATGFSTLCEELAGLADLRALSLDTCARTWSLWLDCGAWVAGLHRLRHLRLVIADSCTLTADLGALPSLTSLAIAHRQSYTVEAPRAALLRLPGACFPPRLRLLHLDSFLLEPVSGLAQLSALTALRELRLVSGEGDYRGEERLTCKG